VLDDVGFSAMSWYGGPVETPNTDRRLRDRRRGPGEPYLDLEAAAMLARE
jgi:hypothetical protein